jgi:hypothetical protein
LDFIVSSVQGDSRARSKISKMSDNRGKQASKMSGNRVKQVSKMSWNRGKQEMGSSPYFTKRVVLELLEFKLFLLGSFVFHQDVLTKVLSPSR